MAFVKHQGQANLSAMLFKEDCKKFIKDERGNVESAMVLIPLLILFLIGMQLSLAVHARNIERMHSQNEASVRAISGEFDESDEFLQIDSSGDGQNLDLLITRRQVSLQDLLPGFLGGSSSNRSVEVSGIAIVENQR